MVNAFCWINGAKHVPKAFIKGVDPHNLSHWGCKLIKDDAISSDAKNGNEREERDTLYYQWIPFMLVISAVMFKIPDVIWGFLEGGFMASFDDKHGRSVSIHKNQEEKEKLIASHVSLFGVLKGRNKVYYLKFLFCQILNIVILIANFYITSDFLDTNFSSYGTDVLEYLNDDTKGALNPMCKVFPTAVSCTFPKGLGTGGNFEVDSHLCILSQNVINEKVYLGLWFWFVFLATIGSIQMLYELIIIGVPVIRLKLTLLNMGSTGSDVITRFFNSCDFADWFFLNQIGKNTEMKFYREFIKALANDHAKKEKKQIEEGNLLELKVDNPQHEQIQMKTIA